MTYGLEPPERRPSDPATSGLSSRAAIEDLRRRLVRFAVKLVWNRDDAEELVQDAFKTAAAKGVGFKDQRFEPWMYRTTTNLCANHRRRRRPERLGEWCDVATTDPTEHGPDRIEQLERLRSAVERLPQQQRLALTMRWMEHLEYGAIAEVMDISESTVRAHVHQARRHLRELMETDTDE